MKQFIRFGMVGVSNTLIYYSIYRGCLWLFGRLGWFSRYDYLVSSLVGFVLSVLWSFYWNRRFTFQEKRKEDRPVWKEIVKTYISYSFTGVFLQNVLLYLWIDRFAVSKEIAPVFSLLITIPINFLLNKLWVFR